MEIFWLSSSLLSHPAVTVIIFPWVQLIYSCSIALCFLIDEFSPLFREVSLSSFVTFFPFDLPLFSSWLIHVATFFNTSPFLKSLPSRLSVNFKSRDWTNNSSSYCVRSLFWLLLSLLGVFLFLRSISPWTLPVYTSFINNSCQVATQERCTSSTIGIP